MNTQEEDCMQFKQKVTSTPEETSVRKYLDVVVENLPHHLQANGKRLATFLTNTCPAYVNNQGHLVVYGLTFHGCTVTELFNFVLKKKTVKTFG